MPDGWLAPAVQAMAYTAAVVIGGAVTLRHALLPRAGAGLDAPARDAYWSQAGRVLRRGAGALLAAHLLRLWAQTVAVFGADDAGWRHLWLVGLESRWGHGWRLQLAASAAVVLASFATPRLGAVGPPVELAVVAAIALTLPLTGHAAGHLFLHVLYAAHVIAAGAWVGTLGVVAATRLPGSRPAESHLLRAFAPIAIASATLLVTSGGLVTWTELGPLANLWSTPWGQLLSAKLALVAGILALGAFNWWRLRESDVAHADRWALLLEVGLALAVLTATGWLTETAHPG